MTPQRLLGNVADVVQGPLTFAWPTKVALPAAQSILKQGVWKGLKQGLAEGAKYGAGFGALQGFSSGRDIETQDAYLRNLALNAGIGAVGGAGIGGAGGLATGIAGAAATYSTTTTRKNPTTSLNVLSFFGFMVGSGLISGSLSLWTR